MDSLLLFPARDSILNLAGQISKLPAMSPPDDLHMHTPLCRHPVGEPMENARHAQEIGLAEIGFSDHSCRFKPRQRESFWL